MSTPIAVLQTSLLHQAALIKLVPLKSSLKCKGTYTGHKFQETAHKTDQESDDIGAGTTDMGTWSPTY